MSILEDERITLNFISTQAGFHCYTKLITYLTAFVPLSAQKRKRTNFGFSRFFICLDSIGSFDFGPCDWLDFYGCIIGRLKPL